MWIVRIADNIYSDSPIQIFNVKYLLLGNLMLLLGNLMLLLGKRLLTLKYRE